MELENTAKFAQHILRLLKVQEITFPIGRTNKGNLGIKFTTANDEYEMVLDAVPLKTVSLTEDDNNIELKRMLEKYWFDNKKDIFGVQNYLTPDGIKPIEEKTFKPKGRPKGSKNRPKVEAGING